MSLRTILGRLTGGRTRPRKVGVDEVHALRDSGAVLIDVRSRQEYRAGHAPGAKNIPVDRLAERLSEIPTERAVVTICQSGGRSARAAAMLSRHGVQDVYDLCGGMTSWQRAGLPVQRS
jgi:rhodanese-related sulfurtransferase